jgi:hypothetical protein
MGDPNEREPCPHRIIDDVGVAFSMGAIGGTFWHAIKGARSSPKGERLYGSVAGNSLCFNGLTDFLFLMRFQLSKAMPADLEAVSQFGVVFSLRMTARLFTLEKKRIRGTL